ncbi:MAG: sulfatase [Acidobacteriota bacterium]
MSIRRRPIPPAPRAIRRPPRIAWPLLLALLLVGCGAGDDAPARGGASSSDARAVVLITIDTLRADHLGSYGYGVGTDPFLTRFAAEGTRFAHAFAPASSTAPSHTSMLTGLYPSFHTVGPWNGHHPLDAGTVTLAEHLADAGFRTGAVVSNPVLSKRLGLDQGFAHYDDALEGRERNRPMGERRADRAVDLALDWLDEDAAQPFFLWLHIQDPHGPYTPPDDGPVPANLARGTPDPDGDGARVLERGLDESGDGAIPRYQYIESLITVDDYRRRYDREIAFVDRALARFVAGLRAHPRGADAVVALTADHGEAFGEDGFWFAHSQSVGLDQVAVPLVLHAPDVIAAGRVVMRPVSNLAVFATLLDAAGVLPADDDARAAALAAAQQPSLLPLTDPAAPAAALTRDADDRRGPLFVDSLNQIGVVVDGVYVRRDRADLDDAFWSQGNPNTGGAWRPLGLELVPLAAAENPENDGVAPAAPDPAALQRAGELLDAYEARSERLRRMLDPLRRKVPLTQEQRDALRALGYAGG